MNTHEVILGFREFLNQSWPAAQTLLDVASDWENADDWLQANWEILVERRLVTPGVAEYLEIYGEGADCNKKSSRVWWPEALPTHKISITSKNDKNLSNMVTGELIKESIIDFHKFVSWDGYYFYISPPFDHILWYIGDDLHIVSVDDVVFRKREVD